MKPVDNSTWWSWGLTIFLVVITTAGPVRSQPIDRNSTRFALYCSQYKGMSPEYWSTNLNITFSRLRRQLTINSVPYATARSLLNGDSVWGLASCRGYVSKADCVACFEYAVTQLRDCGFANGAYVFFDDCDIRYENYNFYTQSIIQSNLQCNNQSSNQQQDFKKTADMLLSDLKIVVPRTSNFYAASTRDLASGNATVYAIGQCNLNISQSDCVKCMDSRYTALVSCLPSSLGRSVDRGCFMKYSTTPFFRQDQQTNITPLLQDGDSSKKTAIIGGVCWNQAQKTHTQLRTQSIPYQSLLPYFINIITSNLISKQKEITCITKLLQTS